MGRIEKTVFISYRRTNLPWALAIYQNLTSKGFDVFFDFQSINSGDFEQIIIGNIRARAHFLILLTPSALERCNHPDDWLRREIETALNEKRNIVPLFFEGFDFGSPSIAKNLTGKLALLKNYNGMNVPADYFNEAMNRLQTRFLNVPLDAVLHPISRNAKKAVQKQQFAANKATTVRKEELSAQEWNEKGIKHYYDNNFDESIHCYTESIHQDPNYVYAYNNRGLALYKIGNSIGAIQDFTEAIRLKNDYANAYNNRGIVRKEKGDLDGAIKDYTEAIRVKPDKANAYNNRGKAREVKGDPDGAIKDYSYAIHLDPEYANAYLNRGIVWEEDKKDYHLAIADYQKYLDLGGKRQEVANWIEEVKRKIK